MTPDFYIKQLFDKLPSDRKVSMKSDGNAWLVCINPDHSGGNERTPSAKIELAEGSAYLGRYFCFGCGYHLSWNEFAEKTGLTKTDEDYKGVRHRRLSFRQSTTEGKERARHAWPEHREWRGVPGNIVRQMGGYVYSSRDILSEQFLILPVTMYEEEVGYLRALMRDAKTDRNGRKLEESYKNKPGPWIKSALMNFDGASKQKGRPLWIVEGPRDVAKCLMAGVRVVGLCGSKFGEERAELIKLLNPPVILCATDNDVAGDKAADSILDQCGDRFSVARIRWKVGDTFNQPIDKIQRVNRRYIEKYRKAA